MVTGRGRARLEVVRDECLAGADQMDDSPPLQPGGLIPRDDGYTAWTRPWRTQIHVISVDYAIPEMYIQIPGWTSDEVIKLSLGVLPWKVRLQLHQDFRCHAMVNLGADDAADLTFSDWEAE